jgi:hypothetical protein
MGTASVASRLRGNVWIALLLVLPVLAAGCAGNGGNISQSDTRKGAVIGGAAGAGIGVKPALVNAAGHTGEKELDGRVDLILDPVVEQKG